jgi:hypothetical protein
MNFRIFQCGQPLALEIPNSGVQEYNGLCSAILPETEFDTAILFRG